MWRHPTGLALDQVARPSCGENPKVLLPIARHVQKGGLDVPWLEWANRSVGAATT